MKLINKIAQYLCFLGRYSPLECTYLRPSFSQFAEDRVLEEYFGGKTAGFYFEVGAYHPFNFSNSYLFYRKGWRGVLVEPNPASASLLRRWRKGDTIVEKALSNYEGSAKLSCERTVSKILDQAFNDRPDQEVATVQVTTLARLFELYGRGRIIDFLSIDCEGHDLMVLAGNNWEKYRPRVVLVEDNDAKRGKGRIASCMREKGYGLLALMGPTLIFEDLDGHDAT